ncbi:MAG: hypothetical protein IT158_27145, partial [Bryobacterales bacterium]|nr:hypothetical protein [Bryobacterales bacterium]
MILRGIALALTAWACLAQTIDQAYTARIREYTTQPYFLTELVDHLPASQRVPTPEKSLGYVVGAPGKLTYSKDIYRYLREVEKASPRVKVFSIGQTEGGREMLLVAISEEKNIAALDRYREITARLADPRRTPEPEARRLIAGGLPLYWTSGSIHSSEVGSPEMLMELAYRLAVEETPFIQAIRRNSIVLITPLLEVDGHDRQVDLSILKQKRPRNAPPSAPYWGKYVLHDNNRDGMAMSLALSRNMMRAFLDWHPQVLHDLHESIPFLYTSTGMGPYNAWLDPIVTNEWQRLAFHEVEEMTKRGVPGVWTHGFYDGWAPNYMFFVAQGHNAIGRFYETYGGTGDAATRERIVPPAMAARTWYRPNPPLPKVKWSLRNNVNLQQSALLLAMNFVAGQRQTFLENFYLKSRRSVEKARREGPAAWVIPADDPRPLECAGLVNQLQMHGIEVHRADREIEVVQTAGKEEQRHRFPSGSYVVRMDQPYSRMADMLLDTQYYNPSDTRPYDDTGWSLGPLRNVRTVRVKPESILQAPMTLIGGPVKIPGRMSGPERAAAYLVAHNAQTALATFRFALRDVRMHALEKPFEDYPPGSFLIREAENPGVREALRKTAAELGLEVRGLAQAPGVPAHPLAAPRIALVHTWLNTQSEGWFRIAFDRLRIPYDYISDQVLRETPGLRQKYDVIIFGPTPGSSQRIVNGLPMRGEPLEWKAGELTPNIAGSPDQTGDMRGGMLLQGLQHLRAFVEQGGLFVTVAGNASIPIDYGLVDSVAITPARELRASGGVYNVTAEDNASPIAYGYGERLAVYFNQGPLFRVSRTGGIGGFAGEETRQRPSGRGSAADPDVPQGRPYVEPVKEPEVKPGEERPLTDEMREYYANLLPAAAEQPRIVFR